MGFLNVTKTFLEFLKTCKMGKVSTYKNQIQKLKIFSGL